MLRPARGHIFLVPYELPGISYGEIYNKMGCRCYPNGEVFFENVRVPKEYMLGNRLKEGLRAIVGKN